MTDLEQQVMDDIFRSWSMAYRGGFTSQFRCATGEETEACIQEWKEEFATFLQWSKVSIGQIKHAIQSSKERHPEYAPTHGEFVALCRAYRPIKPPALPEPVSAPSPEQLEQVRAAVSRPRAAEDEAYRRRFWNSPDSQVACDVLIRWAATGDSRAAEHLRVAIDTGCMTPAGLFLKR